MAMLSARFPDAAAADRVVRTFVDDMGATAGLVIVGPETPHHGGSDAGTSADEAMTTLETPTVRVAIHDNAINPDEARRAFEAAGGTDIKPIQ